jgi:hypothetical protein
MFELTPESLELQTVTKDALTSWSDEKRKEFVKTFKERAESAKFILWHTASWLRQLAACRKFIGGKHDRMINESLQRLNLNCRFRDTGELQHIAKERAESILKDLPPLSKTIQIIKPEISQKLIDRDKLVAQCKKLTEKFSTISETILMSELDQKMTIGEFRKMVKDREKEKNRLALEINEVSKDAQSLESEINKSLYSGIPGLSDAVVKVVNDHIEKEKALDQMTRRVEEQVMFGDSQAAMEILKGFERDELKISDDIKAEFDKAMQTIKLKAAPKAKKALKAKQ